MFRIAFMTLACLLFAVSAVRADTISGPVSYLTANSFVVNSGLPHGFVPVTYTSQTVTGTLSNGVSATVVGTFTRAGSMVASSVTVGGGSTLSGPISYLTPRTFVLNSGFPHGYVPTDYSHAAVSGNLINGGRAVVTGRFLSNGSLVASSVVVGTQSVPSHVKVWTYYGELGVAASVPAAWMAARANYVAGTPDHITAFRNAGGENGVAYTDPVDIIPAAHDPMWDVPEAGWFHDANGNRIWRQFGPWGVQNALNPGASVTRTAFNNITRAVAASSSGYNFVEVDSVGWDRLGQFWGFNAWGAEQPSDAAYDSAMKGLLQSSVITPIFNGLHNIDGHLSDVSGNVMFLPVVGGGLSENCLQDVAGSKHDLFWSFDENTMLYTVQHQKLAICEGQNPAGTDNRNPRTYFLSSWWLTYDPTYSVAFPDFSSNGTVMIFPEYNLVPTNPVQTAFTNVSNLLTSTGAYARQFGNCYNNGQSIGGCAAIVNPSGGVTVLMPSLASNYHHAMVLDNNNSYYGGQVTWTTAIPTRLAPMQGVILAQ